MNTTTIFNGKLCVVLSVFLFLLAADATGKANELINHNAINHQGLLNDGIYSDSTKNKIITIDKAIDTEAPVFTKIPRNGIAHSLEGVAFGFVMAVDNLSAVDITSSDVVDGNGNSGILTRTWIATDKSGNSSIASASIRYYGNDLDEQEQAFRLELSEIEKETLANDLVLGQNYPNPFTKATSVPFRLPKADFVTLRIYDASGRTLLTCSGNFEKGDNKFDVNGSDLQVEGVLYYEIVTSNSNHTSKMIFNAFK